MGKEPGSKSSGESCFFSCPWWASFSYQISLWLSLGMTASHSPNSCHVHGPWGPIVTPALGLRFYDTCHGLLALLDCINIQSDTSQLHHGPVTKSLRCRHRIVRTTVTEAQRFQRDPRMFTFCLHHLVSCGISGKPLTPRASDFPHGNQDTCLVVFSQVPGTWRVLVKSTITAIMTIT